MNDVIAVFSFIDQIATIVLIILVLVLLVVLKNLHSDYGWEDKTLRKGTIILVLMLAYPIYTAFLLQLEIGFAANILMLVLSIQLINQLRQRLRKEYGWLWPQAVWLSLVSVYILLMLLQDYLLH